MFEKKLNKNLGNETKKVLRAFKDKKRMTQVQYELALAEYNAIVEQQKKSITELPQYIENQIDNTEKNYYKDQILSKNVKTIENMGDRTTSTLSYMREELKKHIGKVVIVQYILPEKTKRKIATRIRRDFGENMDASLLQLLAMLDRRGSLVHETKEMVDDNFATWWKIYARKWWIGSQVDILAFCGYRGKLLIYPENENIRPEKVLQYFKEGITNCLYTPILKEAIKKRDDAQTKPTYYKYKKMAEDVEELQKEQFDSGVPEDYLSELANKLQIDLIIKFPLINKCIEAKSVKKPIMKFVFTNTRLNHVELNEITYDNNFIEIDEGQLELIVKKLNDEDKFYIYSNNNIRTLEGNYRVENPLRKAMANFEKENNLYDCKIDDIVDKDLSAFIRNGTRYNETIDFVDISKLCIHEYDGCITEARYNDVKINHIDMKKAYANFWTCFYYNGFLGKITDFRKTDKIVGVGYYYIYDLDFNIADAKFVYYNTKLKIYNEGVYPCVELKMLDTYRVGYKIRYGCWGVKPIDFRFSDELMEHKYYALCVGAWDSHRLQNQFTYKGCLNHYKTLRYTDCEANLKYFDNGEIMLLVDKEHNYHLGHITGFILAYQRLNVLEQLMNMDYNKLIRICVDGIYTTEDGMKLCNVFRIKNDYNFNNLAGDKYTSQYKKPFTCNGELRNHYNKELYLGAGGCGKTHFNLVDTGLVKSLYVSPSWKLAREKEREYGVKVSVWERLVSADPDNIQYIRKNYNVLIVDEVSMMSEAQKNRIFDLYSDMKIIMCGDLGHQLPCFEKGAVPISKNGFNRVIEFTENRRCKCDKLLEVLNTLRLFNKQNKPIDYIKMWIKSKLGVMKKEDIDYSIDDMILVGTNEQVKYYTEKYTGKFSVEKYRIETNNRIYNNGQIVISDIVPDCSHKIQHAFTCHSIQGETAKHKLFIDLNRIFEKTMIYTAISRAEYLSQIYLIA